MGRQRHRYFTLRADRTNTQTPVLFQAGSTQHSQTNADLSLRPALMAACCFLPRRLPYRIVARHRRLPTSLSRRQRSKGGEKGLVARTSISRWPPPLSDLMDPDVPSRRRFSPDAPDSGVPPSFLTAPLHLQLI
jgi:hypothetical protein